MLDVAMIGNSYEDNKNTTRFCVKFRFWHHMSRFNQCISQVIYYIGSTERTHSRYKNKTKLRPTDRAVEVLMDGVNLLSVPITNISNNYIIEGRNMVVLN